MKKLNLVLFLFIGFAVVMTSCKKSKSKAILGKWNVVDMKRGTESMPKDRLKGSFIEFKEDGKAMISFGGQASEEKYEVRGDYMISFGVDGKEDSAKIEELTSDKMIISSNQGGENTQMIFEKSN